MHGFVQTYCTLHFKWRDTHIIEIEFYPMIRINTHCDIYLCTYVTWNAYDKV